MPLPTATEPNCICRPQWGRKASRVRVHSASGMKNGNMLELSRRKFVLRWVIGIDRFVGCRNENKVRIRSASQGDEALPYLRQDISATLDYECPVTGAFGGLRKGGDGDEK
jgi:hypothetical protein